MSTIVSLAYLISGICFIMALRGLASPETARSGNMFGIAGMGLAILTTLFLVEASSMGLIVIALAIGGGIGAVVARKIQMTALPQLVAAFHSLVGLAAVWYPPQPSSTRMLMELPKATRSISQA